MKKIAIALLLIMFQFQCFSQELEHISLKYQGFDREYWLYVPENVSEERPLVVLLHGYGGSAEGYRPEMVKCAAENGFVLCIPQGYKDKTGEAGWNVGYPDQEGMKTDDVAFVEYLVRRVCGKYDLNRSNVFLTGMSNGGEMCYLMAVRKPELFRAIASVSGLTMGWIVKNLPLPCRPVAFMEIHGTADKVSLWEGDPHNNEGWGEYTSVDMAMSRITAMNRCTYSTVEEMPRKSDSSRRILLHRYLGGEKEALLYEVEDGPHSWFLDDIDTVSEIWHFFERQMKCN